MRRIPAQDPKAGGSNPAEVLSCQCHSYLYISHDMIVVVAVFAWSKSVDVTVTQTVENLPFFAGLKPSAPKQQLILRK